MESKLTKQDEQLRQKSIDEANRYKYNQSGKGSELIRKIVFAIIGSCWVLMFTKGKYQETNIFLKATIACSFFYLLIDVLHYFWDTCSYYLHAQNMERCTTVDYVKNVYQPADQYISKRSFIFFVSKIIVCSIVAGAFVLGMFIDPLYGKQKASVSSGQEQILNHSAEFWERESVDNGYRWKMYRNDDMHNEVPNNPSPVITIDFDNHNEVKGVNLEIINEVTESHK